LKRRKVASSAKATAAREALKREVFMESWMGREKWMQMVLTAPLAEATQPFELPAKKRTQRERTLKAS